MVLFWSVLAALGCLLEQSLEGRPQMASLLGLHSARAAPEFHLQGGPAAPRKCRLRAKGAQQKTGTCPVLHWVPVETSVGDCLFLQLEMRWKGSMSVEPSLTSRKHKHLLALVRFPFSPLPWAGPQTWPGSEQHL